MRHEKIPVR